MLKASFKYLVYTYQQKIFQGNQKPNHSTKKTGKQCSS